MTRCLLLLARLVDQRPLALALAVLLPSVALGALALRAPIDLTFAGMLDRSQPEVARYLDKSESLGFGGTLIVLLRGRQELENERQQQALDLATARLQEALQGHPDIAGVIAPLNHTWFLQQAWWLASADEFDEMASSLEEALAIGPALNSPGAATLERLQVLQKRFAEAVRAGPNALGSDRVVQVRLRSDPLVQSFGGNSYFELEPIIEAALRDTGVDYDLSGFPAVAAQDQGRTLSTVRRLSPLSLIAVLLLVFAVERRWQVLLAILAALLLAVTATLGLIGLLAGGLTLMETFFGVTVFGLGIDFAIHLLLRLKEERGRGLGQVEALERALAGTGRGVTAGAVTTAGAFLIVAAAPDPVAVHLGLSGGIGLAFCLVLMLVLVPVAWRRADRHQRVQTGNTDRASSTLGLTRLPRYLATDAVRRPWLHLSIGAVLFALAVLGFPRFALESQIEKVFNRDVPAVRTVNEVRERFGVSGAPWVASVASLTEAKTLAERLRTEPLIASVTSPSDLLSADAAESRRRASALANLHPRLHEQLVLLRSAGAMMGASGQLGSLLVLAEALDRGIEQGPPSEETLPLGLRLQFRGIRSPPNEASGNEVSSLEPAPAAPWLVYAYAKESTFDAYQVRAVRQAVQRIAPEATSVSVLLEAVLLGPRPWLLSVGAGVIVFVVLVLLVDLRSGQWMLLALLPVLVASGMTFGLMCWLPMNFNVMTVMVVPLLIGLGVDDGIHVVHRMREGRESLAAATGSVGSAITMTTAPTCASVAILLFTNHPGLESMAVVMLIGLPLCLLASVSTLPAAAAVLRPRVDRVEDL